MVFGYVLYLGLIGGSLLAVAYGLFSITDGFRRWQEFNALVDVPISSLGAVSVGETAVSGSIETSAPTTVPVGAERCVCYDLTVNDSTDATAVHEERESVTFFVNDGTGRVRIDPTEFELDISEARTESFSFKSYDEVPARAEAFHDSRDLPERGLRRDRTIEYVYLRRGDEVYAYGDVRPDADHDGETDEKTVVLQSGSRGFLADRSRDELRRERRYSLVKSVVSGTLVATLGLGSVLWLTGFAQLFLGG
ncbi:GIDE domain-containing protein [Halorussus halophilus]|uniref:GIDE domain-containing protein n=1 Tax=Halorussus halophilus TaxID=2650975 RepID=UPI0013011973|nr:GIDE domain-containing protein [Halorussus halophilus]